VIAYDIHQLTKRYPGQQRPANKDVNLQIQEGEINVVLVESLERAQAVNALFHLMAGPPQEPCENRTNFGFVVHDQDASHRDVPRPERQGTSANSGPLAASLGIRYIGYTRPRLEFYLERTFYRESPANAPG